MYTQTLLRWHSLDFDKTCNHYCTSTHKYNFEFTWPVKLWMICKGPRLKTVGWLMYVVIQRAAELLFGI